MALVAAEFMWAIIIDMVATNSLMKHVDTCIDVVESIKLNFCMVYR